MKKGSARQAARAVAPDADEVLPEYDFRHGLKNPYAARISGDVLRVTLDPDVAARFQTSIQVNRALRAVAKAKGLPKGRRKPRND